MFGQNRQSAYALALFALASLVIASHVDASWFKDLKKDQDNTYEQLAKDLLRLSVGSGDYAKTASVLYNKSKLEKKNDSYRDLLLAFKEIFQEEEKYFCNASSLESLLRLAEAMAAHGNLDPKKITKPIKFMNWIIIKQIKKARQICSEYLARMNQLLTIHISRSAHEKLRELDIIPHSLLLDNHPGPLPEQLEPRQFLAECAIVYGTDKLALRTLLVLMKAVNIIDPESNKLSNYYQDPDKQITLPKLRFPEFYKNAYRFQACELLDALDDEMIKARNEAQKNQSFHDNEESDSDS